MKVLIALLGFLVFPAQAAMYDFEDVPVGPFRKLMLEGMTIEAPFNAVAFVGDELGRPEHFGAQSIYSSMPLTITFEPMVSAVTMSGSPYKKGKVALSCYLFDVQANKPYPYPMSDTTAEDMLYPFFDNVSAIPFPRFKVTKCIIRGINEGIWIDALGTNP